MMPTTIAVARKRPIDRRSSGGPVMPAAGVSLLVPGAAIRAMGS
jgi:hypothetical protein